MCFPQVRGRVKTSSGEELTYELETDVVEEGVIIDAVAHGGMHIITTTKYSLSTNLLSIVMNIEFHTNFALTPVD